MVVKDLKTLLESMSPELIEGKYVFCTLSEEDFNALSIESVMVFKEKEGITLVLEKHVADENKLKYDAVWALITLTVHSDLEAVGFLAALTNKLAEEGISVNAVSAFYHDHLFIPFDKANKALEALKDI
jgi:hypothetical protein